MAVKALMTDETGKQIVDAIREKAGLEARVFDLEKEIDDENKRAIARENEIENLFTMPTQEAVNNWLDEHPEATTTVQDKSLTAEKFTDDLKLHTIKDYVTPEMFGAKGDGVTDDTEALTKCFANGNKVIMLTQSYRVTAEIALHDNTRVFGGIIIDDITPSDSSNFQKPDGTFKGVNSNNICITGVTFRNGTNFKLSGNLVFMGCGNVTIRDCKLYDCINLYGVFMGGGSNLLIDNVYIENYVHIGISGMLEHSDMTIQNCTIKNALPTLELYAEYEKQNYAVSVYGTNADTESSVLKVLNNYFEDSGWHAIDAHGGREIIISGNIIRHKNKVPYQCLNIGDARHVYDGKCRNVIVENNIIRNDLGKAYTYCIASSSCETVSIRNNIIRNWCSVVDAETTNATVFYLVGCKDYSVDQNTVTDIDCKMLYIADGDENVTASFGKNKVVYGDDNYRNEIITILGNSVFMFTENEIHGYVTIGSISHNYKNRIFAPYIKNNMLIPNDPARIGDVVFPISSPTIEDMKYDDETISTAVLGLYGQTMFGKPLNGVIKQYVCTKSWYTTESPAIWTELKQT